MSSIYGYLAKAELALPSPPPSRLRYESKSLNICAWGASFSFQDFAHPALADTKVFVLGEPVFQHPNGLRYPEPQDWEYILADETRIKALMGNWLIVIAEPDKITAFNDALAGLYLYIHEDDSSFFFTNSLALLKEHRSPKLDFHRFGAYWHGMLPFSRQKYAPTNSGYYQNTLQMSPGSKILLDKNGITHQEQPFLPQKSAPDGGKILAEYVLLPFRTGRKVALGISGGMDIRVLLAIILGAGQRVQTFHFDEDSGADYEIAHSIARRYDLPFEFIGPEKAGSDWQSVCDYIHTRGLTFNPANHDFQKYYPMVKDRAEVFISGYFGELYRFLFFMAHLRSALRIRKPALHDFAAYLYNQPPPIFIPELRAILNRGFHDALKGSLAKMPDARQDFSPRWMNLFLIRHSPQARNSPNITWINQHLIDLIPFMQAAVINAHWQISPIAQLNEGFHRSLIKKHCPALQEFDLVKVDAPAPYSYRQFALKVKVWAKRGRIAHPAVNRADSFLSRFAPRIQELINQDRIREDATLDLSFIKQAVKEYYQGNLSQRDAVLAFVAYALG